MERTLRIASLFGVLLPLTVSVAHADEAGGWHREVSLGDYDGRIAAGVPWHVSITDTLVGPTSCQTVNDACNGPHTYCNTPTRSNVSRVESLRCEGADCTADVDDSGALAIASPHGGTVHVSFDLRDTSGDVRHLDFDVRFADVKAIRVERMLEDAPHGTVYAATPGAAFSWCATLEGDGHEPLRFRSEELVLTGQGPASAVRRDPYSGCDSFGVTDAGDVETTYEYGAFTRVDHLKVVDPADVTAVEVVDLEGIDLRAKHAIDEDVLANVAASDGLDVFPCGTISGDGSAAVFARGTTADGTRVLLPGRLISIAPDELASLQQLSSNEDQPLRYILGDAGGVGELVVRAPQASVRVPLRVHGRCVPPLATSDAGTVADADAGADASADASADH